MKQLSVKILRTEEDLTACFPLWEELLSRTSNSILYLEPAWISLWWKYLSNGRKLHVLCFFDEEKIAGICPFMSEETKAYTKLFFIGAPLSGNMDLIIDPHYSEDVFRALMDYIEDKSNSSVFYLQGFPETSPNYRQLQKALSDRRIPFYVRQTKNYFLSLENKDFDSYYHKRFSKSKIKTLERKSKRLEKIAQLQFRQGNREDMPSAFEIHEMRWERKSGNSSFSKGNARKFFTEISGQNSSVFRPALYFLSLGDLDISFIYLFYYKNQILLKRIGHDDTFRLYNPGSLLLQNVIKECFESGDKILSFGTGEDEYKKIWTDDYYHIDSISFSSRHSAARLFWFLKKGIHSFRDKIRNNRRLFLTLRKVAGRIKYKMHTKGKMHHPESLQQAFKSLIKNLYSCNFYAVVEKRLYPSSIQAASLYRQNNDAVRYFTMRDTTELSGLMKCPPEEIIQRLDRGFQCCLIREHGKIVYCSWIHSDRILLPEASFQKTISSASVFVSETFSEFRNKANTDMLKKQMEAFFLRNGFRRMYYIACLKEPLSKAKEEKLKYSFTVKTTLGKTQSIRTL